ncbi:hypothetical protein DFH08DRAFT_905756 [Mycena albidolilacea]|uniref:Transmembrane protein n=1 Tax=Mycena albidolilacea TaxID=1033008 RepID=A0AAD6Z009_9AGAR|nr:hypothetical protein DFH08DRAFT_905756 [Mycena albidolilacea]
MSLAPLSSPRDTRTIHGEPSGANRYRVFTGDKGSSEVFYQSSSPADLTGFSFSVSTRLVHLSLSVSIARCRAATSLALPTKVLVFDHPSRTCSAQMRIRILSRVRLGTRTALLDRGYRVCPVPFLCLRIRRLRAGYGYVFPLFLSFSFSSLSSSFLSAHPSPLSCFCLLVYILPSFLAILGAPTLPYAHRSFRLAGLSCTTCTTIIRTARRPRRLPLAARH